MTSEARFLAFTGKYGWIVVEPAPGGWTGYWTVPGKYGLDAAQILARALLPLPPRQEPQRAEGEP